MIRNKINNYCEFPKKIDITPFYNGVEVDSDLTFDLTGIIIHKGNSEFGHYYSIIKDDEFNKWILFDDNEILEFEEENIKDEAFGNKDENGPPDAPSAYVLFYRRSGSDKNVKEIIKSVKEIKEPLDLAVFVIAAKFCSATVDDCIINGTKKSLIPSIQNIMKLTPKPKIK